MFNRKSLYLWGKCTRKIPFYEKKAVFPVVAVAPKVFGAVFPVVAVAPKVFWTVFLVVAVAPKVFGAAFPVVVGAPKVFGAVFPVRGLRRLALCQKNRIFATSYS